MHKAQAVLDLDQQLHVALFADQRHDLVKGHQLGHGIRCQGHGRGCPLRGDRSLGADLRGACHARAGLRRALRGGRGNGRRLRLRLQAADQRFRVRQVGHMRQTDDRHFGGHHRIGGERHLFQRLEQHLPHPAERAHRQALRHVQPAHPFVGRGRRVIGRVGRDLDHADPMGDFRQIAQHRHRVCPVGILR